MIDGNKVTKTIPRIIAEKWLATNGIFPKRAPAPVIKNDHEKAAIKVNSIKRRNENADNPATNGMKVRMIGI